MDDYKKQQEEEMKEAIRKIASIKTKPYLDKTSKKLERKAEVELSDLGFNPDYIKYGAGAAKLIDALNKKEIEGGVDIGPNTKIKGTISPREKAIKLLFNKSF